MQISEIVEKEKQRSNVFECRIAKMYREGTFLRAYNWSAWLFIKSGSDLKISNRTIKKLDEPVAMVGFPPSSMEKYAPEGVQLTSNSDGSVDVVFPSSIISDDADVQALTDEYNEWKSALPVTESAVVKKEKTSEGVSDSPSGSPVSFMTLTSIMQRILAYPLESKTPVENITFISEIKQQLSVLI
jgi:hypothetical protein